MPYAHRVKPNEKVDLKKITTRAPKNLSKENGQKALTLLGQEWAELEDLVFFSGLNGLLIVFQGMDTAGKDGAIRHVLQETDGISVRVEGFKVPTEVELSHDFLWRVHAKTPRKGEVVIFNRSHYEDVVIVKVHGFAPEDVIAKRYDHINNFEQALLDSGILIVKFFLHISKDEQEQRLTERENDPKAAWKLSAGDWKERAHWDAYQKAFEIALSNCSSPVPWHIVPADQKWFRNVAVMEVLVDTLKAREKEMRARLEKIGEDAKAELAEFRKSQER
jgi:PPK2 family polyphosphate:nucleotide phosphotransferase